MKKTNKNKKCNDTKMTYLGYRVALPKHTDPNEVYTLTVRPPKGERVSKQQMEYVAHCAVSYLMAEGFLPEREAIQSLRVHCRPR